MSYLKDDNSDLPDEELNKFYKNNGEGFLIATPIENKPNKFTFKYYPRGQKQQALEAAKKKGCLKNWSAVSKFLETNKVTNEEKKDANDEFKKYVKEHWDNALIQKVLEAENVDPEHLDLATSTEYVKQAWYDDKITRDELHSMLMDMPQSCIDMSMPILINDSSFLIGISKIAKMSEFKKMDKEFQANIGKHLDDPFLKKISPNLPKYIQNLNIKQFGFRAIISEDFGVVTMDEIFAFMNKIVPNFEKRLSKMQEKL